MRYATTNKGKSGEEAEPHSGRAGTSRNALAGVAVATASFSLYLSTLAPTVLSYEYPETRDAGALQVKAAVLGISDVTGYPTYTMLTHLFTYLPFGTDAAYRANLASAVYAAAAVYLVYLVCLRLTRGAVAASATGALLFGTGETFWSQAVIAEVYTLNALFVAGLLHVLLAWRDTRRDGYLLLYAFLAGLSLTHHLTSGLLLPAGLLFLFLVDRDRLLADRRLALKGAGLFLAGLLPYLYLPARAATGYTRWTAYVDPTFVRHDPSTVGGFLDLVTGGDFRGAMFAFGPAELPGRLALYLGHLLAQNGPLLTAAFFVVALFGAWRLLVGDRAAGALLGSLYLGWLLHALEYDISDVRYYFIPTYLVLAILASVGLTALLRSLRGLAADHLTRAPRAAVELAPAMLLLAPLLGAGGAYAEVDRSEDYGGRAAIEVVAERAETGATLIHHRSPLWYMNFVEGRRRDVKLVASVDITLGPREIGAARRALGEGSVYALQPSAADARALQKAGLDLLPVEPGLLYEVTRDGETRSR